LPFFGLDLSAFLEVHLGSNDNTWDVGDPTEVDNLVIDNLNHLERIAGADGINKDIAVNADGMLRIEDGELVLASGINDFAVIFGVLEVDSLRKRGFDGRVIGLDEFILAILDY